MEDWMIGPLFDLILVVIIICLIIVFSYGFKTGNDKNK